MVINAQGCTAAIQGLSQIFEVLALGQVGLQHRAACAVHLLQHALQPVQVFILRPRACWLPRSLRQVDDLAGAMALNGGSQAVWANREFDCKVLFAEERLPVLFVFPLDLHFGCVEITQPPGNPNGA